MWDYTKLAKTYDYRPSYSEEIIDKLFEKTKANCVCDIGAGTGILTHQLLSRTKNVVPVEPNAKMLELGIQKIKRIWVQAHAEFTGLNQNFELLTYGSSFNVCNQIKTLQEARRILMPQGYIACLWNHRDLNDELQSKIENIIKKYVPNYQYGNRREDQTKILQSNGWKTEYFESNFKFIFKKKSYLKATKSHFTLKNQSGKRFHIILKEISNILPKEFEVPYKTVMWIAQ